MHRPPPLVPILIVALALASLVRPAGAFTREQATTPMTVTLVRGDAASCGADCPEWLALTGKIGFETPARLAAALARLGPRRMPVLLDSPGGESTAGLAMGRMIRARGLGTAVASTTLTACDAADRACAARLRAGEHPGHVGTPPGVTSPPTCASACVFVLAGGVDRSVPYGAFVGVHQARQVQTFHPMMGMFRILNRIVHGRKVEIGRTLVSSRALPVRVVTSTAPQSLYAEFDRFLLGLGIDESLMPLMRATPPSRIHWLTSSELTSTRVANDTTDAATLTEREAAVQAAASRPPGPPLAAALTLGDARRWTGFVTWRIDATVPGAPALVGDWEIPGRHLVGSVALAADTASASPSSFKLVTRSASGRGADAGRILAVMAPQLCGPSDCVQHFAGPTAFDRPTAGFDVIRGWRTDFLANLHRRDWLVIPVRTDDGWGRIALALTASDTTAVTTWERLCCGVAAADWPWMAPPSALPAFPAQPDIFVIGGIAPVRPASGRGGAAQRTLPLTALYDAAPSAQHDLPVRMSGSSVTWFPLATPASVGGAGTTALLGVADLPEIGLRISIEAGPSASGVLGRLTFRLHILTERPDAFGPVAGMTAVISYDDLGHPLLLPDKVDTIGDGSERVVFLDVPETGPVAGAFQLGFSDAKGRRATVALPLDPSIAALLQAASRQSRVGGS